MSARSWPNKLFLLQVVVVLAAALTYMAGLVEPRALLDDVDAAQALQAQHMIDKGDWVTQQLDGIKYLEKAPLKYWITATLFEIFGVHTWVARVPTVLAVILLCWLVFRIGLWADSARAGVCAGLVLATSIGLFLFTRIIIPDALLTLLIAGTLWCFLRAMEDEKPGVGWALGMWACTALAILAKGIIGLVFPVGIVGVYLLLTRALWKAGTWRRLHVLPGFLLFLAIAVPWHVLAVWRNPPYFDFTLHPGDHFGGRYRGFFWFYFINEHILRFLNERWPRDYDTVPRAWFWLSQLVWFFPWCVFLPAAYQLNYKPSDRAGRVRLLLLCWIGVVMGFFSFSTTQEYYSLPIYPALALLIGAAMDRGIRSKLIAGGAKAAGVVLLLAAAACVAILVQVWSLPTPGDIYTALTQHPAYYRLSLGHMADLTISSFAYLRPPLALAAVGFAVAGLGTFVFKADRMFGAMVVGMLLFFQAALVALGVFAPYLASRAIGEKLKESPRGTVIVCGKYNPLSSVFFYSKEDRTLQNDGALDILEYGSMAPGAPKLAISDQEMKSLWQGKQLVYVVCKRPKLDHVQAVLGQNLHLILNSADKYLFSNQP